MATPLMFDENFVVANGDPDSVSYNGFTFPPLYKSHCSFEPVMDDSGRATKFIRLNLQLECFVFRGMLIGGYNSSLSYTEPVSPLSHGSSDEIDTGFEYIRQKLMEPGQQLKFRDRGVGDIVIQDGSTTWDVDNGPKPRLLDCRMIGNKLLYIKWEVTSSFVNCIETPGNSGVLQWPFSVSFSLSPQGTTTRRISGKIEIPLTRQPNPHGPRAGTSNPFDYKFYREMIAQRFPLLPQFHRSYSFDVSQDRKNIEFSITDTEVESDEAYGYGCVRQDVSLTTSGSLSQGGFMKWQCGLSGSIEVAAGFPKVYAYSEISRIFNKVFNINAYRGDFLSSDTTEKSESDTNKLQKKPGQSYPLLQSLSFTDELFGRTVSFEIRWLLFTTIQTLFKATGLFQPLREQPAEQVQAWNLWKTSLGIYMDKAGGLQDLNMNQNDDVIVSICDPILPAPTASTTTQPTLQPSPKDPDKERKNPKDIEPVKPENTYLEFHSSFDVEIQHHDSVHVPVGDFVRPPETLPPTKPRLRKELNLTDPVLDSLRSDEARKAVVHSRREPTYVLHFRGHAVRGIYPPDVPNVVSYGGQPVIPIGKADIRPRKLATATDPFTGKSYQLFGLIWHKTYILKLPPGNVTINSDGHKDLYV